MSNEAIINELRNLKKVIDDIKDSQAADFYKIRTTPTEVLQAQLRVYANDYDMENGALSSALRLAADTIELLLP